MVCWIVAAVEALVFLRDAFFHFDKNIIKHNIL